VRISMMNQAGVSLNSLVSLLQNWEYTLVLNELSKNSFPLPSARAALSSSVLGKESLRTALSSSMETMMKSIFAFSTFSFSLLISSAIGIPRVFKFTRYK
jgi:hypothetical protein